MRRYNSKKNNLSPLILAIIKDKKENVEFFLKNGVEINVEERGLTPFMWATYYQRLNMLGTLLEHKADIDQTNKNGDTALSIAVNNGYMNVVKSLLEYKANMHIGRTPLLHLTAIFDRTEIAILLIEKYEVNINQTNIAGNTALMSAAYCGNINTTKALLKFKDIDFYCKNKNRETARDRALKGNHDKIAEILNEFASFRAQQNLLVFGLFGSGESSLKTLSRSSIFNGKTVNLISDYLRPS